MVEVALALAIVGIGIAGIMALFPVALNASRDAIGDTYSADAADQFLAYIQLQCENDTRADWSDATTPPAPGARFVNDSTRLPTSRPITYTLPAQEKIGALLAGNIYEGKNSGGTLVPGLYFLVQKTGTATDFNGVVRVWRSNFNYDANNDGTAEECSIPNLYIEGANYTGIPLKYGVAVYVEISWPAEKPFSSREVRTYYLEIFNKNAT